MDPYGASRATGQVPPRQPSSATAEQMRQSSSTSRVQPPNSLSHRIASFADLHDYDSFDAYQSAAVLQYQDQHHQSGSAASAAPATAADVAPPSLSRQQQLRGRESSTTLATLASTSDYSTYGSPMNPARAYDPPTSSLGSRSITDLSGFQYSKNARSAIIEEEVEQPGYGENPESIDLANLIPRAAPMGVSPAPHSFGSSSTILRSSPSYGLVAKHDPEENADRDVERNAPFDITAYLGPTTSQDTAFVKKLQEQEASGKLTLGLGTGFASGTKMRESDLLAAAGATLLSPDASTGSFGSFGAGGGLFRAATLRRSFSRRGAYAPASPIAGPTAAASPVSTAHQLDRRGTIKALAQSEANRRGEVVEVILEDDGDEEDDESDEDQRYDGKKSPRSRRMASKVDLSVVSGSTAMGMGADGDGDLLSKTMTKSSTMISGEDGQESGDGSPRLTAAQTMPTRQPKTQVFYPHPNWKPFSMRWPYLLMLIVLSAGLGGVQELIYQVSLRRPLVSFRSPTEIPGSEYFAIKFLPTIVAVLFGVLWQISDFEVKRLEAFYQMSRENGAAAEESLNVDYITYFAFFRPFRALYCRHYAVAVSSVASLLAVSVVPTLGAAAVILTPSLEERQAKPRGEKHIVIDAVWSRLLTVTLLVIALLGCVLFYLLQTRRSGLQADVKGIAGLASMAVASHIMTDFKGMDVVPHEVIHRKLHGRRYILRNSSLAPLDEDRAQAQRIKNRKKRGTATFSKTGQRDEEEEQATARHSADVHDYSYNSYNNYMDKNHLSQNPHPLMLRRRGCLPYIAGILLFAVLLQVVLFTEANVLAERASWVLTALAVCIKLGWGGLESSVRMMEPYYLLSRRHAPAKTLMLDYTAMPFLGVVLTALRNRHVLIFMLSFGTVMTELLTVLVTSLATVEGQHFVLGGSGSGDRSGGVLGLGLSDGGQETAMSFWVTLGLASFILCYMFVVALVAFLRRRRPFLPRQPNTIASVLAFIHQSKMLYSFVETSKLNNAQMLQRLEGLQATYGLGWFEGRDGQRHCGVDQEELASSFRAGYDYTQSNQPWNEQPVEWG